MKVVHLGSLRPRLQGAQTLGATREGRLLCTQLQNACLPRFCQQLCYNVTQFPAEAASCLFLLVGSPV